MGDEYSDASEEDDADEHARMTLGKGKAADDSEDDDADSSEASTNEEEEKTAEGPEMEPAEADGALLQRGGHQAGSLRPEMPQKRHGAFLQRGGDEDDDEADTDEEEDQETEDKLS